MSNNKTLLDLCREFDAVPHAEMDRRIAASEELDDACRAAFDERMRLGDEIEKRLGSHKEEFEKLYASWNSHHPGSAARLALVSMVQFACDYLKLALRSFTPDVVRLHEYLHGRVPDAQQDMTMAVAQSHVIFATDDKTRPLLDKLRVLLT
jgi:hypothetical protein